MVAAHSSDISKALGVLHWFQINLVYFISCICFVLKFFFQDFVNWIRFQFIGINLMMFRKSRLFVIAKGMHVLIVYLLACSYQTFQLF